MGIIAASGSGSRQRRSTDPNRGRPSATEKRSALDPLAEPSRLEVILAHRPQLVLAILLVLALALAVWRRFVLDDAFISFNYAKSLVEGDGLTWFGVRVEGYTNFLWVLWIALGLKLGMDAVIWAHAGSIAAFLATLCAMWRLGGRIFNTRLPTVTAILLFMGNYTVASFATGGLETMLQTALLSSAAIVAYDLWKQRSASIGQCLGVSVMATLAILTRLDSALPLAVLLASAIIVLPRSALPRPRLVLLLGPVLVVVTVWLAWKLTYYHRVLPNSFVSKVGGNPRMLINGFHYVALFFRSYLLWPFLTLGVALQIWRRWAIPSRLIPLFVLVLSWCIYVVAVGGDFMEFRLLVPMTPFLFLIVAYYIHDIIGTAWLRRPTIVTALSLLVLLLGSIYHGVTSRGVVPGRTLDSIPALASFYDVYEDHDWTRIGSRLKIELGDLDASLALHAVGAIPYYSGLRTVDMYGLNDLNIVAEGVHVPAMYLRPGHQRMFPLQYLRRQGVNFVLGHPTLIPREYLARPEAREFISTWLGGCLGSSPEPVAEATVVAVPITSGFSLLMWYLTPSRALDQRIRDHGWEMANFAIRL
jgi:arabinofuranosyltransferase